MSSKTSWTKTSKELAREVIVSWSTGRQTFTCPVFGTEHEVGRFNSRHENPHWTVRYRGQSYFLKKFYSNRLGAYYFSFGLVMEVPRKQSALMPILVMRENFKHWTLFDTSGGVVAVKGQGNGGSA